MISWASDKLASDFPFSKWISSVYKIKNESHRFQKYHQTQDLINRILPKYSVKPYQNSNDQILVSGVLLYDKMFSFLMKDCTSRSK